MWTECTTLLVFVRAFIPGDDVKVLELSVVSLLLNWY